MLRRAEQYQRMRWKNGGGWTQEIFRLPAEAAGEYDVRISIAEIEAEASFSLFPGFDRTLSLLEGQGLLLFRGKEQEPYAKLERIGQYTQFPGTWPIRARPLGGTTRDLNVFVRVPGTCRFAVSHGEHSLAAPGPGVLHAVYALHTAVQVEWAAGCQRLEQGSTLILLGDEQRTHPLHVSGDEAYITITVGQGVGWNRNQLECG